MSAFWGVVRLEARLRQRDLLVCGAALAGVLAAAVLGMLGPHEAGSSDFLRGGVLLLIVMLGAVRLVSAHRPWSDLRVALPLADRPRVFGRLTVRALLALLVGVAFALWASPGGDRPLVHITTTFLWLLLAGEALSLLLHLRGGDPGRIAPTLSIVSILVLFESWHAVLGDSTSTSGLMHVLRLAGMLGLVVTCSVAITPEWLPTSAPKAVRPRSRLLGGLLRRRPRPRSPAQVLRAMGGLPEGDRSSRAVIYLYGGLFLAGGASRALGGVPVVSWIPLLLVGGAFSILTLKVAATRWSLLRAYPICARDVWGAPVGFLLGLVLAGTLLAVLVGPASVTPQIQVRTIRSSRGDLDLPVLRAPHWVAAAEATGRRPRGMPAPQSGVVWPLRGESWYSHLAAHGAENPPGEQAAALRKQLEHPREYFHNALQYYVHLVHGVTVTTEELDQALGSPVTITESPVEIPSQFYVEYVGSHGRRLSSYLRTRLPGHIRVDVAPYTWKSAHRPPDPVSPPLVLYAYTPALKRLQETLEPRLIRAARWTFAFDLVLLVLLYLAFVRLALIAGPMRWALPLFPLLVAGAWSGSRASATHLAIRDAHLTAPWMMVVTAVLVGATLVWSITKQLGRLSQTSTPG